MNYKDAIEIIKSIDIIAKCLGETFDTVAGRLVFLDDKRRSKINDAIEAVNKWQDMSFEERASAFGYTVEHETNGNKSITVEL